MKIHVTNRKGAALPMAILVITILTAAISAGFIAATADAATNGAERAQTRAYELAEQGLERFMSLHGSSGYCAVGSCVTDPTKVDSEYVQDSLPGGVANVVSTLVRPATGGGQAIFFIRSTGVASKSAQISWRGTATPANRTVGIYATYDTSTINIKAAWLSLSGLVKNGTGTISGIDSCGKAPPVAGVMVDSGDLVIKGGSFNPAGAPPVDTSKDFNTLKAQTNIDWAGIMGGSIPADITIPGQAFPSASAFTSDTNYWPVIRVHTNNYSLPNYGRGMIIVDSNFVISGSNMWSGLILVGGQLTSNGNNVVAGATITGLNFLTGGTPSLSTVDDATANGNKTYEYSSCDVMKATTRLRKYAGIPNTWSDNITVW